MKENDEVCQVLFSLVPPKGSASALPGDFYPIFENFLRSHLTATKRGRMDEQLSWREIERVRQTREALIKKCRVNPFSVIDTPFQLQRRLAPGGSEFQNYCGQYSGPFCYPRRATNDFCSKEGFLGRDDDLMETIGGDRKYLNQRGLSAANLVLPLREIQAYYRRTTLSDFEYAFRGHRYTVRVVDVAPQSSPFIDSTDEKSEVFEVRNEVGRPHIFVGLMVHLIGEYGFFEGKGISYRLEPAEIIRFFNL